MKIKLNETLNTLKTVSLLAIGRKKPLAAIVSVLIPICQRQCIQTVRPSRNFRIIRRWDYKATIIRGDVALEQQFVERRLVTMCDLIRLSDRYSAWSAFLSDLVRPNLHPLKKIRIIIRCFTHKISDLWSQLTLRKL